MSQNSKHKKSRTEAHRRQYAVELRKRTGGRPPKVGKKFWDDTPGYQGWLIEIRNKIAIAKNAVERREQLTSEFSVELLKLVTDGLGFVKGGMVRNEPLVKNLAQSAHRQCLAVQETARILAAGRDDAARNGTKRFWLSWWQPTEDHRPLTDPPNAQVLGWWCSGYEDDGTPTLCAYVQADSEELAYFYVSISWPEAKNWRFCEERAMDWIPGDRFPLAPWMRERLGITAPSLTHNP